MRRRIDSVGTIRLVYVENSCLMLLSRSWTESSIKLCVTVRSGPCSRKLKLHYHLRYKGNIYLPTFIICLDIRYEIAFLFITYVIVVVKTQAYFEILIFQHYSNVASRMSQRLCELSPHFISIYILPFEHDVNNEIIINKCTSYSSSGEKKLLYISPLQAKHSLYRAMSHLYA